MSEELVKKEDKILLQSTEPTASKDDFGDDNLRYECCICHSLCATNAPWVSTFPFDAEYSSDEELKSKALVEVLKCLKQRGIIKFITVHIKDEDRNIDII